MAEIIGHTKVGAEIRLKLEEKEARALLGITVYGVDAFLEMFYKYLGKVYLQEHEAGLKQLFESVRDIVPPILKKVDDARKIINKDVSK